MKKILSLLLTIIFVMSLSTLVYANEVNSTKQIPSSEYSSAIKSAEQSVLDFFAAVENNDYDAVNRISMDEQLSDEARRKTLELQHEEGLFAEKVTILSSEKRSEDMVIVSVSFVMDSKECLMTYPVVLVNNKWVVNVSNRVDPSVTGIISPTPEIDNSIKGNFTWLWFVFRKILFIFTGF